MGLRVVAEALSCHVCRTFISFRESRPNPWARSGPPNLLVLHLEHSGTTSPALMRLCTSPGLAACQQWPWGCPPPPPAVISQNNLTVSEGLLLCRVFTNRCCTCIPSSPQSESGQTRPYSRKACMADWHCGVVGELSPEPCPSSMSLK